VAREEKRQLRIVGYTKDPCGIRCFKRVKRFIKSEIIVIIVVGGFMLQKHFKVSGYEFDLSDRDVENRLRTIEPEEVRKIHVTVNRRKYPVKQALQAVVPELMRSGFTSSEAIRVFRKLGFRVGELDGE